MWKITTFSADFVLTKERHRVDPHKENHEARTIVRCRTRWVLEIENLVSKFGLKHFLIVPTETQLRCIYQGLLHKAS